MLFIVTLCLGGCIESERNALLQFKSSLSDPSDRLSHWDVVYGSDCCRWTGVVCHNITFHVFELHLRREHYVRSYDQDYNEYEEYYRNSAIGGKVNSSLLELKHLSYLDLSNNDFGGSRIPQFIGSMQSLRYLNLSKAGFGGVIPPQLGNLSNLQYLNLHASYIDNLSFGNYRLNVENLDWVLSLSSLEFLDMSGVNLSRSFDWLKVISTLSCLIELHLPDCRLPVYNPTRLPCVNMSSSLLVLDLSYNHLGGPIPNVLQNVTSSFLRELDLSYNNFNSSIPNWFYDLTNLQLLKLRVNDLQGKISRDIGNLTSLISLDMSFNRELEFEKGIPKSFKRFCNLRYLDLSTIKINQDINDILAILSRCISNVLQWLDLSDCQLSGHLTDDLAYFKNLSTFRIPRNVISGSIPLSFGELKSLVMLDIQNNILNGSLPVSFGNLKELEYVDISDNELEGEVSHLHFENLTRLNLFRASDNNNISLRVSSNWIPPLQLQYLGLRSWLIGSQFPSWLCLLKHLTFLDLSNSSISTSVPIAFWDSISSYYYLNFSHNRIYGSVPDIPFLNAYQPVIDLSSNNFSGAVPYFSSNVTALDLSNNSFSGSIFNFLCYKMNEEKQMQVLNLARNLLHGEIPDCWRSWKNLGAVKFSNNKFGGNIPSSIGNLSLLESLNLRNNNLSGEIPWQIQNCKYLFTLDFSENNFVGKFPTWIGDRFGDLRILSLSANKFDGYLPMGLCGLVSLHILNLAHNSFSGMIPSCFSNFVGMATRNDSSGTFYAARGTFMESTILVMKGKVMEYSTNLRFVRSIDLSDNNLSGEIPTEVTRIAGLLSLNLSQNDLTGRIPNNIGDMKGLESIDLSHNQLSGEIPESISTLTFLSTLDFSYNNLFGRIPSSTQLQSFDSSSFVGNQLCGLPLTNNCTSVNAWPEIEEKDENEDEVDVLFYVSMAFGFVFGFWSVVGSLIFIRKWRHFYFHFVYYLGEKIW
ncbi:disease resistance family protein / LRR family protein [Euphorbia peplus]|nr:disease resistance family protein / LRR family protein [Euphorbia peplus]